MNEIIEDIHVIESDVENVDEKCNKIKCEPIYEAIKACLQLLVDSLKCLYDSLTFCKKKN
jgi:hypothetical protein